MLWLFMINFRAFRRFLIHGNSSHVVLYTQCLRYNICSAWFLDIRISTCFYVKRLLTDLILMLFQQTVAMHMCMSTHIHQMMVAKIN